MTRSPESKPPPSLEDKLQADALEAAAKAMVPRMQAFMTPNAARKLGTLGKRELMLLAGDVIGAWVRRRTEQAATYTFPLERLIEGKLFETLDDPLPDEMLPTDLLA